jgi:hypothetical protein
VVIEAGLGFEVYANSGANLFLGVMVFAQFNALMFEDFDDWICGNGAVLTRAGGKSSREKNGND